ncbi:MAG: hypothetical protein EOM50_13955 [Erysipelotrichia bacterium]|nr:hypothetical protein [Erysipelotrichia bacterium]
MEYNELRDKILSDDAGDLGNRQQMIMDLDALIAEKKLEYDELFAANDALQKSYDTMYVANQKLLAMSSLGKADDVVEEVEGDDIELEEIETVDDAMSIIEDISNEIMEEE